MSVATLLREWADKELAGTQVNRESHLGYIAARRLAEAEALLRETREVVVSHNISIGSREELLVRIDTFLEKP